MPCPAAPRVPPAAALRLPIPPHPLSARLGTAPAGAKISVCHPEDLLEFTTCPIESNRARNTVRQGTPARPCILRHDRQLGWGVARAGHTSACQAPAVCSAGHPVAAGDVCLLRNAAARHRPGFHHDWSALHTAAPFAQTPELCSPPHLIAPEHNPPTPHRWQAQPRSQRWWPRDAPHGAAMPPRPMPQPRTTPCDPPQAHAHAHGSPRPHPSLHLLLRPAPTRSASCRWWRWCVRRWH